MATRIYAQGNAVRIERNNGQPPQDYGKGTLTTRILEAADGGKDLIYIHLIGKAANELGAMVESIEFDQVQDATGTPYSISSSLDVQNALNAFFFLANGASTLDTSLVFDNTKTNMARFGIDSFSDITVISAGNSREGVFFNQAIHSVEFTKVAQGFGGSNWVGVGGVAGEFTTIVVDYAAAIGGVAVTDMTPPSSEPTSAFAPIINFSTYTRFKIWRNDAVSPVQYTLFGYNGSIFVPIYATFTKNTAPFSTYTGIQSNSQLALSKDTGVALGLVGLDIYLNGGSSTSLNQGVSMLDVALGTPLP